MRLLFDLALVPAWQSAFCTSIFVPDFANRNFGLPPHAHLNIQDNKTKLRSNLRIDFSCDVNLRGTDYFHEIIAQDLFLVTLK